MAFSKLHPKIQEAIWNQKWDELRPLQVEAIDAVSNTDNHLILAAATASGKTEAAFLPILSQLAAEPPDSIGAIYVSPLKALINDQFGRLEALCEYADIPVHRWHGDVSATAKKRLLDNPGGVLLITPESLESQFINRGKHLPRLYSQLRFIVIDELHAFLDVVRGVHLESLLARLQIAAGVVPRKFGLSATIGDFMPAQKFLCADAPDTVTVIRDRGPGKELRIRLQAFIEPPDAGETDQLSTGIPQGLDAVAQDVALRFRGETNLLFCNSRRQTEMLADKLRQTASREKWPRDPFVLHHGSISKELREEAEHDLKSGLPLTAICTSSLEMGIDIGSVKAVGQVGPTWRVSSLVQRLGRSGRKDGEAQILRLYTLDEQITEKSSLTERLYPELIRAIAIVELMLGKWLEPPSADRFDFSTCIHQVLSILRQSGGTSAARLFEVLCQRGAFRQINSSQFMALLKGLGENHLIQQMETGRLVLAPDGERIVESRDFYAAFAASVEYRVEFNGQNIGTLSESCVPEAGEFLLLAGRRWQVTVVDAHAKLILVVPAKKWQKPRFEGGGGDLHSVVAGKMREVLKGDAGYRYLSPTASEMLAAARQTFRAVGLADYDFLTHEGSFVWFPWAGSKILRTLELLAKADGLKVDCGYLSLRYIGVSTEDFSRHATLIASGKVVPSDLVQFIGDFNRDRFDEYVAPELLESAYASEMLDFAGATQLLAEVEGQESRL